jgi:Family of unknown function (DUF6941)
LELEDAQEVQVRAMITADGAQAVNGKLYILGGGFDHINMPQVPFQHRFDLAILIDVPWTATNEPHHLVVELLDADGDPLGYRAELTLETGRPPGMRRGTSFTVPIALPVIAEFPEPGRFALRASINGTERNRVAIEAVSTSPPGG